MRISNKGIIFQTIETFLEKNLPSKSLKVPSLRNAPDPKSISFSSSVFTSTWTRKNGKGISQADKNLVDLSDDPHIRRGKLDFPLATHQQVLILDIPVDNAVTVTRNDGLDNLNKEIFGQVLVKVSTLGDEVKEVLAGLGSLHHDDERVVPLEAVNHLDNFRTIPQAVQQANLQRHQIIIDLEKEFQLKSYDAKAALINDISMGPGWKINT